MAVLLACRPIRGHVSREEVRRLVQKYGLVEAEARFMVAIERGEIDGDTFVVADDDEAWHT